MENQTDTSFHAYIRGIILIGFALLQLGMIISGSIRLYIAPTMLPFVYAATIVLFILGVIQILRSTSKKNEDFYCDCGSDHSMTGRPLTKVMIYGIFVAPVVLGFSLPDQVLDSSVAANRGIQYGSGIFTSPTSSPSPATPAAEASEEQDTANRAEAYLDNPEQYLDDLESGAISASGDSLGEISEEEHYMMEDLYEEEELDSHYKEIADAYENQDEVIITEDNFLDMVSAMDIHLDSFKGKEIEVSGFVYREPEFNENQMVVARFSMTCCIADATVYGLLVESEEAVHYEEDSWVTIRGTIQEGEYGGFTMPSVHLQEITEIDEPDMPYVFPSFR
ncbi:TIGR03943 family putative permease subunit [Thalassorhabdus alkalitolerans]|uniref:TIGR03943 family putative permease subunit n=1 Tax=Thalassorhabdus alkalitolerans TaxID=2282697 RepID=A0ABW0YU32_9BACI